MTRTLDGWALVTGATGGIGEELARRLAADGRDLVLVGRRQERLAALKTEFEVRPRGRVEVLALDLGDSGAVESLVTFLRDRSLRVSTLVNNAGYGLFGPLADMDPGDFQAMLQVNVLALAGLTRALLPAMVAAGQGQILNVASLAGFMPGPFMAGYYASKAFVLSFSEGLAEEVRGTGVTVTALCPGATRTGFEARASLGASALFSSQPVMEARKVAAFGYRALLRGKVVAVPGLFNKAAAFSPRLAPRALQRRLIRWMQRPLGGKG